jgi:phosphate transport system permease protein
VTTVDSGTVVTQVRADPKHLAPKPPVEDRPRSIAGRSLDDRMSLWTTLAGALALTWVLYYNVLPFNGLFGFFVCSYFVFLAMYAGVTAMSHPRPVVVDRTVSAVVFGAAAVCGIALLTVVVYTFWEGHSALGHLNFFTHDMAGVRPADPLNKGGILHAVVGTGIELAIAITVSLPLGVGTAVFMTEVGGPLARATRTVVEAMTALPDILAGLFIYTTLVLVLGQEQSGFAAGCALSVMMVPIIARAADVVLRVVPGGLREAGLALGASQWSTVWRVVLPTARPGLATALILGVARAVGETAPVLLTSGPATGVNANPFHGWMNSLPLFVINAIRSPQQTYIQRGFGAASVLLALVLVLFIVTRLVARQRKAGR